MNQRELKYILPAILYGWQVEYIENDIGYWAGDKCMPVRVGKLMDGLVKQGYMEKSMGNYRATAKAKALRCNATGCIEGDHYNYFNERTGKCKVCDGLGAKLP